MGRRGERGAQYILGFSLSSLLTLLLLCGSASAQTKKDTKKKAAKSDTEVKQAAFRAPPALMQVTRPEDRSAEERARDYQIQLEPPPPSRVFHVESEKNLRERIRQEARQRGEPVEFPKEDPATLAAKPFVHQPGLKQATYAVPHVVCYKPLYFEDLGTERYGWDAGIFQPFASAGKFYCHLLTLPYNMGVLSPHDCECNTGYFLPGECTPHYCHLPPWSWKGAAMQAGAVAGGVAIFP